LRRVRKRMERNEIGVIQKMKEWGSD